MLGFPIVERLLAYGKWQMLSKSNRMTKRSTFLLRTCGVVILLAMLLATQWLRVHQIDAAVSIIKHEGNGYDAVAQLRPWAYLGDSSAQILLGSIYAYGWAGVQKDDDKAIYWFRRAAFLSSGKRDPAAPAEFGVAKDYAEGTNVKAVDKGESLKWLRRAAAGGDKEAAKLLAKETENR